MGVSWFVLPKLSGVFSSMNVELPLFTRILISIGDFITAYGYFAIPAFIAFIVLLVFFLFIFPDTKHIGQAVLMVVPGVGKVMIEVELARSFYVFGTLLEAGIPIVRALESLKESATLRRYEKFFTEVTTRVKEGFSFQKCFEVIPHVNRLLPSTIQQMIISAEQSGRLGKTLLKIGETYEDKSEDTTKNLIILLEPIMLIVVWLMVAAIALAVVMPIYSLVGNVDQMANPSSNEGTQ